MKDFILSKINTKCKECDRYYPLCQNVDCPLWEYRFGKDAIAQEYIDKELFKRNADIPKGTLFKIVARKICKRHYHIIDNIEPFNFKRDAKKHLIK